MIFTVPGGAGGVAAPSYTGIVTSESLLVTKSFADREELPANGLLPPT